VAYAHYSTALWPSDSNFIISSLSRVLRALEQPTIIQSRELFQAPPQNSFFDTLLYGKSQCFSSILSSEGCDVVPSPPQRCPTVPLLKKLYLQLDNSAKDNKNRFVMAFYSLLTTRDIFKEVTVGFLVVGHIHEDINAYFSYLSKLLKQKNTYVLADFIKTFMDLQKSASLFLSLSRK
jgi:hypothetical protein